MLSFPLRITMILAVALLFCCDSLFAQGRGGVPTAGRGGTPPPRSTPGPAGPTGGRVTGGSTPRDNSKPRAVTTTDLDEARKRKRRKEERDNQQTSGTSAPAAATGTGMPLIFQSLTPNDVRLMSTHYELVAKRGQHPFTEVKVLVANLTDSYISVQELRLNGRRVTPLDVNDGRDVPLFPLELDRFADSNRLNAPIPPRQRKTYTFAFPFAIKSPSDLDARISRYVKFTTAQRVDWSPLKVVDWSTPETVTNGKKHQGMIITLQNKADFPVNARVKVSLNGVDFAGGKTYFLSDVAFKKNERKTLVLRTIPDQGLPPGSPDREQLPERFKVKKVEIADLQF
jgi:hypothetical protein